jgi:hypothetical protein
VWIGYSPPPPKEKEKKDMNPFFLCGDFGDRVSISLSRGMDGSNGIRENVVCKILF